MDLDLQVHHLQQTNSSLSRDVEELRSLVRSTKAKAKEQLELVVQQNKVLR